MATVSVLPPTQNGLPIGVVDPMELLQAQERYDEERSKRLHKDLNKQYIDLSLSKRFVQFEQDPWVDESSVKSLKTMFPDGRCKVLIIGAGLGGIVFATRLIDEKIMEPQDIRIIDSAGGFGGTWYWNRYPGLTCDIESYCYLPFLEKTGYVPKHRYSHGEEIRLYANLIAEKWNFASCGVFQTSATKLKWNDGGKEWMVELEQKQQKHTERLSIRSQFVVTANGVLNHPKLPGIPGILDYQGDLFHSARWNYEVTGGSPTDADLSKLRDKRVAVIGTGASSVQVISEVAKYSKHLYIVQRTPAAVDHKGQRATDQSWFKDNVASGKGWQRERMRNFHAQFTTEKTPAVNLVADQWTTAQGMVALRGNPFGPTKPEQLPEYVEKLHNIDLPRQNRIRARVMQVVKDKACAQALQPWYPTWCKRPCFHDEYYSIFNQPNVTLIDTAGKGLEKLTADGIIAGGQKQSVDVVIFATGFRAPFIGCPADKANMEIIGRDGINMSRQWAMDGPSTLHGLLDTNFPNLFMTGPWQTGLSGNNLFNIDILASEAAYILQEANKVAKGSSFSVRPTRQAATEWGDQIQLRSGSTAALAGCTPNYVNNEGLRDTLPPEKRAKAARGGVWGFGIEDYVSTVERWKEKGQINDLEIEVLS